MQPITPALPLLFFLLSTSLLHFSQPFTPPPGVCPSCFSPPAASQSIDFGRIVEDPPPSSVFSPRSPEDVSLLLMALSNSSTYDNVTVGPNGARHSTAGQAQVPGGVVVEMRSLPRSIKVDPSNRLVDADGGALWVEVLQETLKHGLSPRSWTDYLYLTVGGTLSVGGISGQTFKYGPQIMNVLEMDVVTGRGQIVTCSMQANQDLFLGVLGGLGQFGIITRATILLHAAAEMAKWVTVPYESFIEFAEDQKAVIDWGQADYVEGKIVAAGGNVTYEIVLALYYNQGDPVDEKLDRILTIMGKKGDTSTVNDVSYFDFLNRVRKEEEELRKRGLWEVPHPWLNVFVPSRQIGRFHDLLLPTITSNPVNGPLLIYPLFTNRWNPSMSTIIPMDDTGNGTIFVIGILRSANTSCKPGSQCMQALLDLNKKIIDGSVGSNNLGAKLYLAPWKGEAEWSAHFGKKWEGIKHLKAKYDPLHILALGSEMFQRIPVGPYLI